jgi:hypothetical protein
MQDILRTLLRSPRVTLARQEGPSMYVRHPRASDAMQASTLNFLHIQHVWRAHSASSVELHRQCARLAQGE